jgi:oxygen-dependent protoporphyrinogen oxidase
MGIIVYPSFIRIYRWHKANPQYDVGHLDKVGEIQALCAQFSGLYVTGSAFEGVGVPDCVRQGKQTAQKLITDIGF